MRDLEIPYSYFARHDDKHGGWFAGYTFPRNGVQHVAYVRGRDNRPKKFEEDEKAIAEREAADALVDALNAEEQKVEGREVEFTAGKRARLKADANKYFTKEFA